MAHNPHYLKHVQSVMARVPTLAAQWVSLTLGALRASNTDLALANDRRLLFQLMESLQNQRKKLEDQFAYQIQAEIEAADRPSSATSLDNMRLDQLKLVDESEAEKEIEISRTLQLIDLKAEWELRELQAFAATLQGESTLRPEANIFRPTVFARALSNATNDLGLSVGERNLLLRIGAKVLSELLRNFYAEICDDLRNQGYTPLAYRAVTMPPRIPASDINVTQPGALQSLLHRIPSQHLMGRAMPAPMVAASLDHALGQLPSSGQISAPPPPGVRADPQTVALMSRLFEQMVKDEQLQPAVQKVIAQLQPSVLRVAMHDPRLLRTDKHPAWRFMNEVASYANGHTGPKQSGLSSFMAFLQPLVQNLVENPRPQAAEFEEALHKVQNFIELRSQAELQPTQQAVSELEIADQRQALKPILRQQVARQLAATKVTERVKDFLSGPWVDVLAHTMATHDHDDAEVQTMLGTVDDLLMSLQRPATPEEHQALRRALPSLIDRLQKGMALIDLPEGQRDAILDELMIIHSRYLRSTPKPKREPTPEELVRQMQDEMALEHELDPEPAPPRQELDTNVGSLPTVPMSFGDEAPSDQTSAAVSEWVDSLHKGSWCKLLLQGQWVSAHLLWFSANRQFFMFSSDHAGRMHSLTRRALERLRSEGLATSLEDRNLMQRAVDSLLQDLDTNTGPL